MTANNLSLLFSIILFNCAVKSGNGEEVFTKNDYYKLKGESFCKTRGAGFVFENICHEIADENGFKNYEPKYLGAFCTEDRTISVFDKEEYDLFKIKETLLLCAYNRVEGRHTTQFASKAIGVGKEEKDVMEYEYDSGVATPFANRTGLLNRVHVMTLEQFARLKGLNFCSLKKNSDFLRYMCENVAQKNNIVDYSEIQVDSKCQQTKISIYFRAKRENVNIKGELLLCNYIRESVTFAARALGRGKEENDVMEYAMDSDVAQPQVNRPDLLKEIHVLTSQQYNSLEGEEFCTTRKDDAEALTNLCAKVADANGYESYAKNKLNASCRESTLAVFSENENKWVRIEENLLHCTYKKEVNPKGEGESLFKRFASKALGKGKKKNDVMEYNYSYSKFLATPFSNRVDFLI